MGPMRSPLYEQEMLGRFLQRDQSMNEALGAEQDLTRGHSRRPFWIEGAQVKIQMDLLKTELP